MENQDNHSYDDIINLPNPTSTKHPRMPLSDRAAQFSPFAALTGHEAAIKETYDNAKAELDSAIASGNEEEIQKKQTAFDEASENLQAAQNEKEWAEEDLVNAKSEYKRLSGKEIDSIDRATAEKHLSDAEKALTEATNKANALETEAADLKAVYEKKAKDKDDAMEVCNQKNTAWQTAVNKRNAIEEKENKNLAGDAGRSNLYWSKLKILVTKNWNSRRN